MSLNSLHDFLIDLGFKRVSFVSLDNEFISITFDINGKEMTFFKEDAAKFSL